MNRECIREYTVNHQGSVVIIMKPVFSLVFLLGITFATACSTSSSSFNSSQAPKWVYSEPEMYSVTKFLTATGSASKNEQAKARSISNLAKIFEVQVRDVSTVREDVKVNIEGNVETVKKDQRMVGSVNLKTDKMMQGVRIAEQWFNSKELTYHALAVLDRTQAGNSVRREMNRLDEETQYSLNQSEKRNDILLKISDLQTAKILQQQRQALQKSLIIIDVSGKGLVPLWRSNEINERLQLALRQLPLETRAESKEMSDLANMLQGAVSKAGFTVQNNDNNYQLIASLDQAEPIKSDGWYWLRATLKLELIAQDGVTVMGFQSWPLKVTAGERTQLQSRLHNAVNKKLEDEVLNSILQFAS
jgi:hypothetical protein